MSVPFPLSLHMMQLIYAHKISHTKKNQHGACLLMVYDTWNDYSLHFDLIAHCRHHRFVEPHWVA